jgi:drug/metabolite transporter (DMT)-like permease
MSFADQGVPMTGAAVVLALTSALCFGVALVLTHIGLRYIPPLSGAAISIPSSTLLFIAIAPIVLGGRPIVWAAVPIFTAVGILYPAAVTLLTFAANRALGPVITSSLGNLAPLFAVGFAVVILGEPLLYAQIGGLLVTVAGVVIVSVTRGLGGVAHWRSWALLLPLAAAAVRGFIQPSVKVGLAIWPSPFAAVLTSYIVSSLIIVGASRLQSGRFLAIAPLRGHLWFVLIGVLNGLAVLLLYAALANGPVALVAPLVATYPLVTIVGSKLLQGKIEGGPWLAIGVALTVLGVVLLLAG